MEDQSVDVLSDVTNEVESENNIFDSGIKFFDTIYL